MRNQLLIGYSTDEMFSIDTIEGLDINITKNIYSIEDPSKRLSDFTKTIEVPGSKGNDNIFGALFDVNFHIRDSQQLNPDFNPSKKAVCQYIQDGHVQIDGYCQLTDIKILNENKVIYVIVIYGQNADLFSKIGDKTLNDITGYGATLDTPITSGTFNWNDTEIQASWINPSNGYLYYPFLNRGLGFTSRPSNNYLGGAWGVDYNFFKPWAYARTLFTSILKEAGFNWTSTFLNSDLFKKLIVECDISKFVMAESDMLASQSIALGTTTQNITMVSDGNQYIYDHYAWIFNSVIANGFSEYDNTTGTITVSREGFHELSVELNTTVTSGIAPFPKTEIIIIKKVGSSYFPVSSTVPAGTGSSHTFKFDITQDFKVGDEIRICVRLTDSGTFATGDVVQITGSSTNKFIFNETGRFMYGTVNPISAIFYPMKQTDFLMGIVKMFNLYIEPQADGSLLIEPRDDFFTNVVTDWTTKLDTSKDFVIKPQGLLNVKQIDFNYQQGLTDASKAFNHATGQTFGYKRAIFDNDFVKDIKKVDIPFICEPLQVQTDQGIVLIRTDYNGAAEEITPKPMIAFAGGLYTCGTYRYYDAGLNTYTDKTQYAYAGFLDEPTTPTYDLTFGDQELYFHSLNNTLKLTTNGDLWSRYHRKQWTEIGDRDSKLVECYIKLNAYDIATISFRQSYWIQNAAYRLLEVQDYSPNGETTTKCIFLKLNDAETLTPSTSSTIGNNNGGNTGNGGGTGGDYTGGDLGNGMNVQQVTNGLWQGGAGNKIQNSVGVLVSGSNNSVGYGCFNIQIKGSNNTVYPGLSNVTLINCDGIEVTESDVQYIDNIKVVVGSPTNGQVWAYNSTTNQIEFATNQFADLNLFFFKTASDIATYYKMLTSPSTGGSQDITVPNCSGTTLLATFATEPSSPGTLFIPTGVFKTHFHAKRTNGGNATIYAEVYKRNIGGTETLLATTPVTSTNITLTIDDYELEIYNPTIIALLSTDRLVIKFYTVVSSGTPDIGIYIEDAYLSRLEFLAGGAGGGGATTFTSLTDVPSSYTGSSLKGVRVNSGETALEFYTITPSSGFPFNNITTTSDTMAVNNGYLANNAALVTLTLPSSASSTVLDIIKVKGAGAGGFRIAQNISQKIRWASGSETTVGVSGYIESTDANDYIEIMYIATNTWSVASVKGTFTIA